MTITFKSKRVVAAILVACLSLPQILWAQQAVDDSPRAMAMAGDLLVARPIGAVVTVAGAAAFLVSLPFTLLSGNVSGAADTLVVGPAENTFVRCLGCTQSGYTHKDSERYNAAQERRAEAEAAEAAEE